MAHEPRTLDDGREWNGLAYVHNSPVAGCKCDSCVGYFPRHVLKVISLHDAHAECSCGGWSYAFTGERTRAQVEAHHALHMLHESDRARFTYSADANGYMIFYRGKPIGGAGVKLPREKPLHWKHARANVKENGEQARRSIAELNTGNGEARFRAVMQRIDAEDGAE